MAGPARPGASEAPGPRDDLEPGAPVGRVLLPRSTVTPLRRIAIRILIAFGALVATAVLVHAEGDCYRDGDQMGGITWGDAFYYATVTLSTTGYGDITPVCQSARWVNVLVITPLRLLFLIVLVGTTIEVLTQRFRDERRTSRWRRKVHNHTVIVGFGVKGRAAARTLLDSGRDPLSIVVVSNDAAAVADANRLGLAGVLGDARRDDVLHDAGIERASDVVVALHDDDISVLVTLTARRLAPDATIVAAARESINGEILRQSGATSVIPTADSAGHLMGLSVMSPVVGGLMEDLLDAGRGLEVVERAITSEELGLSPGELDERGLLVLAVVRHGEVHRFDRKDVKVLQRGDRLVVIRDAG